MAIPIDASIASARKEREQIIALRLELGVAHRSIENLSKRYRALLKRHDFNAFVLILSVLLNVILTYVVCVKGNQ